MASQHASEGVGSTSKMDPSAGHWRPSQRPPSTVDRRVHQLTVTLLLAR